MRSWPNAATTRELKRLWRSAQFIIRTEGVQYFARDTADFGLSYILYPFSKSKLASRHFTFEGRQIPYVRHHYNRAWRNERSVEVALARDFLSRCPQGRVLELGNVLAHYQPIRHEVLDKYEISPGVLNIDIVDLEAKCAYDVVLSISTLEHIGWDEEPRDPEKVLVAYERLKQAMGPAGAMLVTVPLGHNPHLDGYVFEGRLDFPISGFLRRTSRQNDWMEVDEKEACSAVLQKRYHRTNAIYVGMYPPT